MEMEKINKNTIRVVLNNDDLTARGVKFLDLLGNQKEIENFFYDILDEIDTNYDFRENDAVTFQLVPNKGDSLEIFITKIDPEDVTTQNEEVEDFSSDDSDFDKSREGLVDVLRNTIENKNGMNSNHERKTKIDENDEIVDYLNEDNNKKYEFTIEFEDFEDFVQLSHILKINSGVTNLYNYQNKYYLELILFDIDYSEEDAKDISSIAYEYGNISHISPIVLKERGKLIMEQTAFELARHFFKN